MNFQQDLASSLTVVIPVRVDSKEREDNLRTILSYLNAFGCHIIVLEADATSYLKRMDWGALAEYVFVCDTNPIFHRTKYINMLLRHATTEIVAVWDADVLVPRIQVDMAACRICEGFTISYPYNGEFVMLNEKLSSWMRQSLDCQYLTNARMKSCLGRRLCGGAFFVHRNRYLQCGGENERFVGWGLEDAERWRRVMILGHKVCWSECGQLYHLYHPHGKNSQFWSDDQALRMRKEFVRVCGMDQEEMRTYIHQFNRTNE